MAAPHDPTLTRVRASATQAGTFTEVGFVRSAEIVRGSEGDTTLRWFGGDASRPGDKVLDGSLPVWWDDEDLTGQKLLQDAYDNGTPVWLQFCPKGTTAGAKAHQFEATITETRISMDPEADGIEGGFSYRGAPSTYSIITLV